MAGRGVKTALWRNLGWCWTKAEKKSVQQQQQKRATYCRTQEPSQTKGALTWSPLLELMELQLDRNHHLRSLPTGDNKNSSTVWTTKYPTPPPPDSDHEILNSPCPHFSVRFHSNLFSTIRSLSLNFKNAEFYHNRACFIITIKINKLN